jgi:hypothetical protein
LPLPSNLSQQLAREIGMRAGLSTFGFREEHITPVVEEDIRRGKGTRSGRHIRKRWLHRGIAPGGKAAVRRRSRNRSVPVLAGIGLETE